jgi:hypothetical protein
MPRFTLAAAIAVPLTVLAVAPASAAVFRVDLSQRTGPVHHGANGALYGLSNDGVPSDNLLAPLKIGSIAQKPPGGLQHPNGDAPAVADGFLRSGGGYIQVYMQDIYPSWPYDDRGIDDYLAKVDQIVRAVAAGLELGTGERIVSIAAGGGGYGDPLERDVSTVMDDVLEGRITAQAAREAYGVVTTNGTLDREATARERDSRRHAYTPSA